MSFGRVVAKDKSKRDRVDLIFEDRRVAGCVDGRVDRFRMIVCPWTSYERGEYESTTLNAAGHQLPASVQATYEHAVEYYHRWKTEEERLWKHWSIRYIEYFGPRSFIPVGSSFT